MHASQMIAVVTVVVVIVVIIIITEKTTPVYSIHDDRKFKTGKGNSSKTGHLCNLQATWSPLLVDEISGSPT